MPASLPLRAAGLISAITLVAVSAFYAPALPPGDRYQAVVKLLAGLLIVSGALLLSREISGTFLGHGRNSAFKALYWASLSSAGAGLSEASSSFYAMNVSAAVLLSVLAFSAAGLMLIRFQRG